MLEKVKEYYESEYKSTKGCIDRQVEWMTPAELVNVTLHQMLGIAQFVQTVGVSYEEIDKLYTEYKEKLEKLLDN